MDYVDKFRVEPGSKVKLQKIDPDFTDKYKIKNRLKLKSLSSISS